MQAPIPAETIDREIAPVQREDCFDAFLFGQIHQRRIGTWAPSLRYRRRNLPIQETACSSSGSKRSNPASKLPSSRSIAAG